MKPRHFGSDVIVTWPSVRTSVRPSAPQGYQYASYTGYNPVLKPMCFWSETRVVAKQAKTTKVKTKFVNGKKKFKWILSCLFGGRGKVQFRRKKLGDKVQAKSSNLPCRFCSNRSAHRLSSQLFAAVSTPNIAELVLFGFFCPQPWFLRRSEHILPGKTPAFSCW